MSNLVYLVKAVNYSNVKALVKYTTYPFLLWVITFKGREGWTSRSHDAYMSIDESGVKRRGTPVQHHLGQSHSMAPVSNDRGGYQAMINSLQVSDVASRSRTQV